MGVIPNVTPKEKFTTGDIVTVRRGKHIGTQFVVIGTDGEKRFFIADGVRYKTERPKVKNQLHLQRTRMNLADVAGRVAGGKPLDNGWLMQKISGITEPGGTSCKQEDEAAEWPKKR